MKWYRSLKFRKRPLTVDAENYKIVTDADIVNFILERAGYYNLSIKNIDLEGIWQLSCVQLFGDKSSFLAFANDFVQKYRNYIEDIGL